MKRRGFAVRPEWRRSRAWSMPYRRARFLMVLVALVLLSGCGSPAATSTPRPTPISSPAPVSSGEHILELAQHTHLRDATYTYVWILKYFANTAGPGVAIPTITSTGSGELTADPAYDEDSSHVIGGNKNYHEQAIYDETTQTQYVLDPSSDGKWLETQFPRSVFWLPVAARDFLRLTTATLVGAEQVNGAAVWHIRGTLKYLLSESGTVDLYLRQDTDLPIEMVIHETTEGLGTQDETVEYTRFNTGITIALPSNILQSDGS